MAQRQGRLPYKEMTGGSSPPRTTQAQIRQLAERSGLNPDVYRFESCSGYYPTRRLGRQLADHLGLEPGMLWVRLPPVLLKQYASVGHWQAPLAVNQSSEWTLAVQLRERCTQNRQPWRGAMMVLQRGFQSRQRGFDSRPRHWNEAGGVRL